MRARKPAALTAFCRPRIWQRRYPWVRIPPVKDGKWGFSPADALPRGNRFFERLADLLVDELEREAFLEVSHHAGLHLAQHDQRFQRRGGFRGGRRAPQRQGGGGGGGSSCRLQRAE